jgi:hypothetical protein
MLELGDAGLLAQLGDERFGGVAFVRLRFGLFLVTRI